MYTSSETSVNHNEKVGGYLLFGQSFNGQIAVVIVYPHIEGATSQKSSNVLERVDD